MSIMKGRFAMNQYSEMKCSGEKRVGYAYVPVQRLGKVYQPSTALKQGTIFPELDIGLDEYTRGIWNGK